MKIKQVLIGVVLIPAVASFAGSGQRALLDVDEDVWKGYSQFELRQVDLDDPSGALGWATVLGGSAGFVLNDHWLLGAAGYIVIDELEQGDGLPPVVEEGDIWYVGARCEYLSAPYNSLYWSAHLLVGGGQVTALNGAGTQAEKSSLVMIEPGVTGWLKVYEFLDLGAGIGYSVSSGLGLDRLNDDDLSAFRFTATIRFHEF